MCLCVLMFDYGCDGDDDDDLLILWTAEWARVGEWAFTYLPLTYIQRAHDTAMEFIQWKFDDGNLGLLHKLLLYGSSYQSNESYNHTHTQRQAGKQAGIHL